jgi:hypothetical protein
VSSFITVVVLVLLIVMSALAIGKHWKLRLIYLPMLILCMFVLFHINLLISSLWGFCWSHDVIKWLLHVVSIWSDVVIEYFVQDLWFINVWINVFNFQEMILGSFKLRYNNSSNKTPTSQRAHKLHSQW